MKLPRPETLDPVHRLPWREPSRPDLAAIGEGQVLALSAGDPWGHALAICCEYSASPPPRSHFELASGRFVDGPLGDISAESLGVPNESRLPALFASTGDDDPDYALVCDDPIRLARVIAPSLFEDVSDEAIHTLRRDVLDAVYRLGCITDQRAYEETHDDLGHQVETIDRELGEERYLGGERVDFRDVLLYTFSVRLDPVYYELYKATIGRLADFGAMQDHARDLYEDPAFFSTTDFEAIKKAHYLVEPVTNPKQIVPSGGMPDLDAPHFRAWRFRENPDVDQSVEEDQEQDRVAGEWVRGVSRHRDWIRPDDDATYPAEPERYHLYAPYNCPWSHRALLARAVKGLEDVVDASIVYFRRDPERGWQFNPDIPGCTEDRANGYDYIEELYQAVGSDERSVPVLWDTATDTIVSNESAEILRMFNSAFGELAGRDIDLYPARHQDDIDRINEAVYQRINNGAYKAGFADSQQAYERAFARYFRALDWLEHLLDGRRWLVGSDEPTEADLRLFPTVFRHDAVYYARFKLNRRKVADYPRLSDWLARMFDLPGVEEASNLDHARNGYFGRTGNEIVPAGPMPLGLSPKDFSRAVWLNET